MKNVDLYGRVRHASFNCRMSSREAARVFGVDPRTIAKMLAFSKTARIPAQPTCTTARSLDAFTRDY